MSLSTCESDKPETLTNTNIADNSIAYTEASATENTNGDFPESFTEDQSAATGLVSTKLKGNCDQTDIQGKLSQETKHTRSHGIEHEKETIPKTVASQIENGHQDKLTDSNLEIPDEKSRINKTERENITAQFEDCVPEKSLPGQAVVEETTQLPKLNSVGDISIGMHTEQNSLKNQDTVGQSGSDFDQRIISKNGEELLRHENSIPLTGTYHSSDVNKKESDKKAENVDAVAKQDSSSLNLTISKESQFIRDNAKTMAKVPGTLIPSSQSMMSKDSSDNLKPSLPLASAPNNLEKDCQKFNNSKTTKYQSQSLDNSKINVFTPTPQPSTNVNNDNPYMNNAKKNFKLYESPNGVNLKTTQQSFDCHTSQSFNTHAVQTKPSMPLLPQISADNSTLYQRSHFGEGQMPGQGQPLYQPNRPLQPNIQRPTDVSTPLQRASSSYMDNCTLLQNKYVNEINPTNQINIYNANQNNTDTNQGPLNLTDTRSKLVPNNYKAPNVVRLKIQNMSQQHKQPTTHSVRSSNLSVNDKEMLESDPRFLFQTTPGMNNGFSHNQRSYSAGYDAQSVQCVRYLDNANIRRNNLCDRTSTVGNGANNNQREGTFSVQQFQQNANQFGSQYLLMWPNPNDQMTGTDKLRIPQPFTNQGIVPSYQQPCKNIFPNPVKDNVYLNPNDAKRCKNQFSDGRLGLFLEQQNREKIANTAINHDRIHQEQVLQSIQRTYNTNGKCVAAHQSEIFRNRDNNNYNNNTYPLSQNSLQWGQSSEYVHQPNCAGQNGNDLKIKLQSSPQSLAESQAPNSHLQRPSYDHHYPDPRHFPLTNANRFPVSDAIPPPPKIQNSTRSNVQTRYAQYPIGSQSSLPNPEIPPNFQGQKMTTTTSTLPATSTTLEAQKKANTSTRDGSRLASGQHSESQRYRNNIPEFSTARPDQAMPTFHTLPTMANNSKLGTRFPPSDTNTIRPNYTNSSASYRGQIANNPDSILACSQYYLHNFDPTRPLHQSHSRGYMNYDSQQREQNSTQFNSQQNNIDSPFYASQSYNNYTKQIPSTAGGFQEAPRPPNSSNSIPTGSNVEATYNYTQQKSSTASGLQETSRPSNSSNSIPTGSNVKATYSYTKQIPSTAGGFQETTRPPNSSNSIPTGSNVEATYSYTQHNPSTASGFQETPRPSNSSNSISKGSNVDTTYNNSNMSGQTFENVGMENQLGITGKKFPVAQEISNNMAADKMTLNAETPETKAEFPAQTEMNEPNPASSEQFQGYNCASGLYPKCSEISADISKSGHTLPPSSFSGSSTIPDDFLSNALTNPNLGMTSEESFLFSDFDPLFTSSLLTNDLDYFPGTNAAFDQCFEDAASVTMAMVARNEARTRETLDHIDPSLVPVSQQQQLTPLLNITGSNNNGGGSVTDIPSSRIQYNQILPSQTTMGANQIDNQYNSGVDNGKLLVPLVNKSNESMCGYVPGVDLLTLSSKTSRSNVAKPDDVYPNDSVQSRFSDLYNLNSASNVAIPIVYDRSGTKWVNPKGTNAQLYDTGAGLKRNRRKPVVSNGPPKRRGRPPKNGIVAITNFPSAQSVRQEFTTLPNPAVSSNTGTGMFGENLPKSRTNFPGQVPMNHPVISIRPKLDMANTSPSFPVRGNLSAESEIPGYRVGTGSAGVCMSDKINSRESGSLLSEDPGGNYFVSIKSDRGLSDREVIDAVTKCLESISRNEEQPNPDQINEEQLDTNSENTVSHPDDPVPAGMDSPSGSDGVSLEDQALSKEETLMKAYIELKKKLEERMSRSLWRQSYLKRHEPKNPKYSRKLSKKECMTAYSGTTNLGPEDDLFSRYPNRSTSKNSGKLGGTTDPTSIHIDINSGEQRECSNQDNIGAIVTEPVKNPVTAQEQIPVSNDQQISSPELSEPKCSSTSRLPSMTEVVRARLSYEAPSLNTNNPEPLASEVAAESPVLNGNIQRERTESAEEPNDEEMSLTEPEQVKDPEGGDASNIQPEQPRLSSRHLLLQPYSPSPLLPPRQPPPMPPKVVHCVSKREKNVGPTIVENAKNCFEAIGIYLTKADSDFDSFLISYANVVQGLLNCGADRYSRIKAILLNRPNLKPGDDIIGEENKTITLDPIDAHTEEPSVSNHDIDASDIQGDADRRDDQIDVDDFSSSYADIVMVILSSRAYEYRNIKQAISRHICGFTDLCQWPTNNAGKKVSNRGAGVGVPVPASTGCDEVNNVAPSKGKQNADVDVSVPASTGCDGVNNVALSKGKQNADFGVPVPVSTGCDEVNNVAPSKAKQNADFDVPVPALTGCDEMNNVAPSKAKQKPKIKIQGKIFENPVTKKRRKRKIQERAEDIGMQSKLVSHDGILETDASQKKTPKQKVKKLSKTGNTLKDRKRSSFDDNGNSSGLHIILSSNSFIEQNVTYSDSSLKLKPSDANVEQDDNVESQRPISSDDGFVEESTGDYIMNMDSESGGEERVPGISETGPLNGTDQQKPGVLRNTHSSGCSINKVVNNEGLFFDETPKVAVDEVTTKFTENNEEAKRQRPSRKSAGVGPIKFPCSCCDDESSLKRDSVENNSHFLNMSFKKRNRAKIVKPKSANPSKRRGRPQKIETSPQKIISQLVKHIGDTPPIRSDGEEPCKINIPEDLVNSFSVTNMTSQIPAMPDDKSNFRSRRELYSKLDSDSDSNESSDVDVFMNSSCDESDDKWKPKKPGTNGNKKTPKKNQLDFKYNLFHKNRKASFVGDGTARCVIEENKVKMAESASDGNETRTKDPSLNSNADFQSLESSKGTNEKSFKEFGREKIVSKARISFKEFVPNLSYTPLPEIPKEEHSGSKKPKSLNSIENHNEASKIFTGNDSNIRVESNECFKSFDREGGDRIRSTSEDGGSNLTDNHVVRNIKTEVNVNSPSSSNDASFQPQDGEIRGVADVPKEQLEDSATKMKNATSEKPNETSSCEDRLRSLIETITEINTTTKQVDEDRSNSVKSGSVKNRSESFMRGDLEPLDGGHLGSQSSEEMRVKTESVERIDETIGCQIGINDMDDSSSDSSSSRSDSDSSSSRSDSDSNSGSEEEEPRKTMTESHSLTDPMEVKMPSPLNSSKRNLSQTLKVTSVSFENKIIIRKTWLEKNKKFDKLKCKTKNIFDILSSNETEDEEGFARGGLKRGNQNKKAYGEKKALSIPLGVKKSEKAQSSKSKMSLTKKNIVSTNQDKNINSGPDKLCLSLPNNGNDKSLMLSENQTFPRINNLKIVTGSKKKHKKTTKSFGTSAKTLPVSEGLIDSGTNQKDIIESSQTDTKVTISDSFQKQVVDSKMKLKKNSKKSKTGLDEASSNEQKICLSFDSPKRKKRRTSLEPPNNSHMSAESEMEGTDMMIVSGIIRRRREKITYKSYSDPNFITPSKQESSLSIESGKDRATLKQSAIDLPNLQCTYCPKYFKKPSELLYHTRSHTGERPFPCNQCNKSFVSNVNLQRHRRTHSSERKHVCPTCDRGFTQHYGMLVHQLIHSGLKPHKCPDCPSAFRTNGYLSCHRRKRHPEEMDKERI